MISNGIDLNHKYVVQMQQNRHICFLQHLVSQHRKQLDTQAESVYAGLPVVHDMTQYIM